MPTKNPRINITFDQSTVNLLTNLALKEHKSLSSLSRELVIDALELREDIFLSSIAEERENANEMRYSHSDAWK